MKNIEKRIGKFKLYGFAYYGSAECEDISDYYPNLNWRMNEKDDKLIGLIPELEGKSIQQILSFFEQNHNSVGTRSPILESDIPGKGIKLSIPYVRYLNTEGTTDYSLFEDAYLGIFLLSFDEYISLNHPEKLEIKLGIEPQSKSQDKEEKNDRK